MLSTETLIKKCAPGSNHAGELSARKIWDSFCTRIEQDMFIGRGVNIPQFGMFGFKLISREDVKTGAKKHRKSPIFILSERFARNFNVPIDKKTHSTGVVPAVQINYSSIALASGLGKDVVTSTLKNLLQTIGNSCRDRICVLIDFRVGQFHYRPGKYPFVIFKKEFIRKACAQSDTSRAAVADSMENYEQSSYRPASGRALSSRPSSASRPQTASHVQPTRTPRPYTPSLSGRGASGQARPSTAGSAYSSRRDDTAFVSADVLSRLAPSILRDVLTKSSPSNTPRHDADVLRLDSTPAAAGMEDVIRQGGPIGAGPQDHDETNAKHGNDGPCMDVLCQVCRDRANQIAEVQMRRQMETALRREEAELVQRQAQQIRELEQASATEQRQKRKAIDESNRKMALTKQRLEALARERSSGETEEFFVESERRPLSSHHALTQEELRAALEAQLRERRNLDQLKSTEEREADRQQAKLYEASRLADLEAERQRKREQQSQQAALLAQQLEARQALSSLEVAQAREPDTFAIGSAEILSPEQLRARRDSAQRLYEEQRLAAEARREEQIKAQKRELEEERAALQQYQAHLADSARTEQELKALRQRQQAAALADQIRSRGARTNGTNDGEEHQWDEMTAAAAEKEKQKRLEAQRLLHEQKQAAEARRLQEAEAAQREKAEEREALKRYLKRMEDEQDEDRKRKQRIQEEMRRALQQSSQGRARDAALSQLPQGTSLAMEGDMSEEKRQHASRCVQCHSALPLGVPTPTMLKA